MLYVDACIYVNVCMYVYGGNKEAYATLFTHIVQRPLAQ